LEGTGALTATLYKFGIDLADALEFTEGIAFSRGLSEPEEPSTAGSRLERRWVA